MSSSANIDLMNSEELISWAKGRWNTLSEKQQYSILELEKAIKLIK